MKFLSLAGPEIVKMTTTIAAGDENVVNMVAFPFQWYVMICPIMSSCGPHVFECQTIRIITHVAVTWKYTLLCQLP